MSAELRKNRLTFIHAPILAEIVARLKAGEPALAQYLGGKQACFPRTVVGLTPSFRRSLPETGCLSQGLPHGKRRTAWLIALSSATVIPNETTATGDLDQRHLPQSAASPTAGPFPGEPAPIPPGQPVVSFGITVAELSAISQA